MESKKVVRAYNSPLRKAQMDATRRRILDAVAELMSDPEQPELTFLAVAEQAQVSERTVYRHFENKDELLEAFWEHINEQLGMAQYPETIAELLAVLPSVYTGFDQRAGLIRAHLASTAGREMRLQVAPRRREIFRTMLESHVAELPEAEKRWACAITQLLFSPRAWESLAENWNLGGEEAATACAWAIRRLLANLPDGTALPDAQPSNS